MFVWVALKVLKYFILLLVLPGYWVPPLTVPAYFKGLVQDALLMGGSIA